MTATAEPDARRLLKQSVGAAFYGKFRDLRPAQAAAIEPLLDGRNVVIASGTGSGKTEAAAAPLVSRHMRSALDADAVALLYVAPTRALVNDLYRRLGPPLGTLGLRLGIRHGEQDDTKTGELPHVLITTPESLDVMLMSHASVLLDVQAVVIDEVHLLLNTQRGLQLSVLLRRLTGWLGRPVQWAALSATVGNLRDVVDFLFDVDEPAELLDFPSGRPIDAIVRHMASPAAFAPLIAAAVAGGRTKVLVFVDSRRKCENLVGLLTGGGGISVPVFAHYSSLSKEVREETEAKFMSAPGAVCVATSTLELGIDIGDIDLVALWGAPSTVESFLQRIGRGNRRRHVANVVCFIPDDCEEPVREALTFLALLDAARKGDLPQRSAFHLFGAFGQQSMSSIAAANGGFTRLLDLLEPIESCGYCDRDTLEALLDELVGAEFLERHGFKRRYGAADGLWRLVDLRMIWGNFPIGSSTIELRHGARVLGDVPVINLMRLKPGSVVPFAGQRYRVRAIKRDGVEMEPAGRAPVTVELRFGGGKPGIDVFLANRMWEVLAAGSWDCEALGGAMGTKIEALGKAVAGWASRDEIPYIRADGQYHYFTFAGRIVNRTLADALGDDDAEADDLVIKSNRLMCFEKVPAEPNALLESLDRVFEGTSDRSLYQSLLPLELQIEEFRQPWLRDRTVPAVLERVRRSNGVEALHGVPGLDGSR